MAGTTFLWGLKRSGIHLVVSWLYANHGGRVKEPLVVDGLHPQLRDGFCDPAASVAYFNNCGRLHSRGFALGGLSAEDFDLAARRQATTIFGIEDCALSYAAVTSSLAAANVLVLRDPLNNLASRLEAGKTRPEVFRVDAEYIDLLDAYCAELLGRTSNLPNKTTVSYNRFVTDRVYRDAVAEALGLPNLDVVSEVSPYGGGSSFTGVNAVPNPTSSLMTRFQQHPIPRRFLDMLLERSAVREACTSAFGYDLAELAAEP